MSPEQAAGRRAILDHRTDIYSLGATLYELLTLRPVFPGRDRQELLRRIAEEEPAAPRRVDASIPRDLETVILRAMAKDAAGRYATAQELAEDLERFLADQPIRARRPSPLGRVAKWARRHRAAVATAAILIAVAAALGGLLLWREQQHKIETLNQAKEARERYQEGFLLNFFAMTDDFSMEAMGRVSQALYGKTAAVDYYNRAKKYYQAVIAQTQGDPAMRSITAQAHRRVGFCLMLVKDPAAVASYRSAIELFERLAAESPRDIRLRSNLAGTFQDLATFQMWSGDFKQAEGSLRRSVDEWRRLAMDNPNESSVLYSVATMEVVLVQSLQAQGRGDEATRVAGDAIEFLAGLRDRPPRSLGRGKVLAGAFVGLGTGLVGTGLRREAEHALERGLEMASADGTLNNNLAWLLVEDPGQPPHDPSRAVELAERAVADDENNAGFWNTLGVARYRAGDLDGAEKALKTSMEKNGGGDPNDWLFLAMLEHRRGNPAKAREWLHRSVGWIDARKGDRGPGDEAVRRARAEAEALLGGGAPQAAAGPAGVTR
jgi:tetratricopeptide (TPR) repeat protein